MGFWQRLKKAVNYSQLIPQKIVRSDGRTETYWTKPEDLNQGMHAGQMDLFSGEDAGGARGDSRGYFDHLDRSAEDYQVKPLIEHVKTVDPQLASRLQTKYAKYPFNRDIKEADIELDYQVAWYLRKMKATPNGKAEWEQEFHEKNDPATRGMNRKKATMLKLKKGVTVRAFGQDSKVEGFSPRGFPILSIGGKKRTVLYEELEA